MPPVSATCLSAVWEESFSSKGGDQIQVPHEPLLRDILIKDMRGFGTARGEGREDQRQQAMRYSTSGLKICHQAEPRGITGSLPLLAAKKNKSLNVQPRRKSMQGPRVSYGQAASYPVRRFTSTDKCAFQSNLLHTYHLRGIAQSRRGGRPSAPPPGRLSLRSRGGSWSCEVAGCDQACSRAAKTQSASQQAATQPVGKIRHKANQAEGSQAARQLAWQLDPWQSG